MKISHEEYIEAVNLCKTYLVQQSLFNDLQLEYSKYLENKIIEDDWKKAEIPFKVKVLEMNRKNTVYNIGDILNVTRVSKVFYLHERYKYEKINENEIKEDSVYTCTITFYYTLEENGKERSERVNFDKNRAMETEHRKFKILK
jgi:hypothetical protein